MFNIKVAIEDVTNDALGLQAICSALAGSLENNAADDGTVYALHSVAAQIGCLSTKLGIIREEYAADDEGLELP